MDNDERYAKISRSIVKIYIGNRFFHGFVAECQPHAASVIASAVKFPMQLKCFGVILVFPDGKTVSAKVDDIGIVDEIASIPCNFSGDVLDMNLVQALKLCPQPLSMSEEIYTYSAYQGTTYEGVMTRGFVIELRKNDFLHNCSATENSPLGALVVNKSGDLVGLCYCFDRYLTSINVPAILQAIQPRD